MSNMSSWCCWRLELSDAIGTLLDPALTATKLTSLSTSRIPCHEHPPIVAFCPGGADSWLPMMFVAIAKSCESSTGLCSLVEMPVSFAAVFAASSLA